MRDYLRNVVEQARVDGYTETIFGRRRPFPDLTSPNRVLRDNAERAALNAPIQGSRRRHHEDRDARDRPTTSIDAATCDSRMLLQVHDELVFEVAPTASGTRSKTIVAHRMGGRRRAPRAARRAGRRGHELGRRRALARLHPDRRGAPIAPFRRIGRHAGVRVIGTACRPGTPERRDEGEATGLRRTPNRRGTRGAGAAHNPRLTPSTFETWIQTAAPPEAAEHVAVSELGLATKG